MAGGKRLSENEIEMVAFPSLLLLLGNKMVFCLADGGYIDANDTTSSDEYF